VAGDSFTRSDAGTSVATNASSAARRSASGSETSDFPFASTSRSKTISDAGLSSASF